MTDLSAFARRLATPATLSVVASVGAVATVVLSPAAAHAGVWSDKCGTGYALERVLDGYETSQAQYAEVRVYTKGTGAGTDWCAITVKKGPLNGVATWTYLKGVGEYRDGTGDVSSLDQGNFKYWAGPVKVANRPTFTVWSTVYSVAGSGGAPAYRYLRFQEGVELSN
jgi:hypothetical protein